MADDLEQEIAGAVVAAQSQVSAPHTITGIVGTFGEGGRANGALARELHARMENPPKYETVLRNVDRWLMGERGGEGQKRTPGPKYREALNKIATERIDRVVFSEMLREGFVTVFTGGVIIGDSELDYSEREITANISPSAARPIVDALRRRDLTGAADAYNEALFNAYFEGKEKRPLAYIADTDRVKIYVGDSRPVVQTSGTRL